MNYHSSMRKLKVGRKLQGDKPKAKIAISLDADKLARIDGVAKDGERSSWIEDAVDLKLKKDRI